MNFQSDHMNEPMKPPKIGLALGGGVARGWAHIGAVRALNRAGIRADVICGTSIGALVGGFHLTGNLDQLEAWALNLTKRRMIGYLDVLTGGSGLFGGKKLEKVMRDFIHETKIEDLDRKFAAVTTELATGHEIWLQEGSLVDAIRASYALPGVFTPVRINRRWLIDGALVNPVPVSVCRALGARLVIAVSLNSDSFGKSSLPETNSPIEFDFEAEEKNGKTLIHSAINPNRTFSPQRLMMRQIFGTGQKAPGISTVMLGSLNIIMDRLGRSRMAGDPADVLVTPRLGHISLLEFDRAEEMIALGEEAMEQALPKIEEAIAILQY